MSENERSDVESRIIEATIACIEKNGIEGSTIRRIAEYAGVNSAAINYYFRTKDRLIEKVMAITLDNAFDWAEFTSSEDAPPRERLVSILDDLIAGALAYPGVSRAHFYQPFARGDYSGKTVRRMNEFAEQLHADLLKRGASTSPQQLRVALVQIFASTIVFAGLMPDLFNSFVDLNLRDPDSRRVYVEQLVDALTG